MKQVKRRLYGLYFLIVATFGLLMYFVLSNVVETRIIEQQSGRMDNEIATLTLFIEEHQSEDLSHVDEIIEVMGILSDVSPVINERITFLNVEGEALYDSVFEANEIGSLFKYAEIQQILNGEIVGVANQKGNEITESRYYVAQAVYGSNNQPIGILRLSSELTDLTEPIQYSFIIQLISTAILATGRIIGESAALIYTLGSSTNLPSNLFSSGRTLAVHMYVLSNEGFHVNEAYATAVVLLVLVLFLNGASTLISRKLTQGGK